MFKVKIGEDEYEVSFDHEIPTIDDRCWFHDDPQGFRKKFGTVCMITCSRFPLGTYLGSADLSIKDNFNRNIGRKVSLAKALQKLFPDDVHGRRLFWREYYRARNNRW